MNEHTYEELLKRIEEVERDLKILTDKTNAFIQVWHADRIEKGSDEHERMA